MTPTPTQLETMRRVMARDENLPGLDCLQECYDADWVRRIDMSLPYLTEIGVRLVDEANALTLQGDRQ